MVKKSVIKKLTFGLAVLFALTACTPAQKAPELLEPVGSQPTYRPAFRTDIGAPKVLIGRIQGKEYAHFFEKNLKIDKVNVEVGQYVHEGDVLVEADLEALQNEYSELQTSLTSLNRQHEFDVKNHDFAIKKLNIQKEEAQYLENMGAFVMQKAADVQKSIDVEEESFSYNNELYEFNKRKLNESISETGKLINEGYIKAKHDGYVTYVKDLRNGLYTGDCENIVTVTDDNETYIGGGVDTRSYAYKNYKIKVALWGGKKVPIEEIPYTDAEMAFAKAQNLYAEQRFRFTEETDFKLGDYVVLEFFLKDKNNVLVVGKDSYSTDESGNFVYIKKDDGSLEKRYFEMGDLDDWYAEVLSGIEEGEEVLYTQSAALPAMTGEYEVVLNQFKNIESAKGIKKTDRATYNYYSPDKGEVVEVYVHSAQKIQKGDPLMKIAVDSQKGRLVEIQNRIKNENTDYEAYLKDFDKNRESKYKEAYDSGHAIDIKTDLLNSLKKQLSSPDISEAEMITLSREKAELEAAINADSYTKAYAEIELEKMDAEKEFKKASHESTINSLNKSLEVARKENDGTGYKTIYARYDGEVTQVKKEVGHKVNAGDSLVETADRFEKIIKLSTKIQERRGFKMTITADETEFKADVIKGNDSMFPILFTENERVYLIKPSQLDTGFYLEMEDDSFFNVSSAMGELQYQFESIIVDNVYRIPLDYVFEEISFDNQKYNYVWVKNGDEAYKKYVTLGSDNEVGSSTNPVVINGLSVGDVLVK